MDSQERRNFIYNLLEKNNEPLKGERLGKKLGVTRQIIVKDIAILRASGSEIIATPKGYIISEIKKNNIKKVIAVCHRPEKIEEELQTIVKFGGIIEDVIIEHKLYGEIRGILMIKTPYDIQNFMSKLKKLTSEPLSILTGGIHLHTITVEDEASLNNIINELKKKNFIIEE